MMEFLRKAVYGGDVDRITEESWRLTAADQGLKFDDAVAYGFRVHDWIYYVRTSP